jgi:hypothetical protein
METIEEIQDHIDSLLVESDDNAVELLSYASLLERMTFFAKLRELIRQKDYVNDETASAVLGWAYERLAE